MIIIEAAEVFARLDMGTCIGLMREVFTGLRAGRYVQPERTIHRLPRGNLFGFMPAYLGDDDFFGAKVLDAYHTNRGSGYPSHMGYVMMFEAEHGRPVGLVDATSITQIRTGAVSAVATDLLASPSASSLALIGAGAQARAHLEAICRVRAVDDIRVYDIDAQKAVNFAKEAKARFGREVSIAKSVREAALDADIICTLTPSREPVLDESMVGPGAHVNAVGAFTPTAREVTSGLVARARVYADSVEALRKESGEYLIPLAEGRIGEGHILGGLGDLLAGSAQGRESGRDVTLFIALGLAVEDVLCARYLITSRPD